MDLCLSIDVRAAIIRAYSGGHIGSTAFFRNRPFIRQWTAELATRCSGRPSVLVHAASIGAEPYSLAMYWVHSWPGPSAPPRIVATDIDETFLNIARRAVYPSEVLTGLTATERNWFEHLDSGHVRVPAIARNLVEVREAQSFLEPIRESFDGVMAMNALTYVTRREQAVAIRCLGAAARHLLGLTAFHAGSIRADVERARFAPVRTALREIHEAWGLRCADSAVPADSPDASWRLSPFDSDCPDREFAFCSLFARQP